jgi:CheY-like chemotaxis protein
MDLLVREVGRLGSDLREKDAALRTVEDQLREARRAAGVASRVNALAHDLNNLLTGILGYARVVLDRVGPGDPIRRQLAIIENVAQRAVDLTGGLVSSHPLPDAAAAAAPTPAAGLQLPGASVIGGDAAPSAGLAAPVAPDPLPDEVASATILAVDDESTVLALAKDVLEMHGHRVLTARNGEEALRVFRAHQTEIDLVLLDLTMPVMGGRQCFRELRRIDPGVRVVISSGFSSESSASELLAEGAIDYLQKPYDIDRLARAIASALARRNVAPKLLRSAQN